MSSSAFFDRGLVGRGGVVKRTCRICMQRFKTQIPGQSLVRIILSSLFPFHLFLEKLHIL